MATRSRARRRAGLDLPAVRWRPRGRRWWCPRSRRSGATSRARTPPSCASRMASSVSRERADLVHLDQDRVGRRRMSMPRRSRSALVTKRSSPTSCTRSPSRSVRCRPAVPVVLGQAVLDRDDRVAVDQVGEIVDHLRRRRACAPRRPGGRRRRGRSRSTAASSAIATSLAVAGASARLEDDRRSPPRSSQVRARTRPRRRRRSPGRARAAAPSARGTSRRPIRSASANGSAPTGTTMNSWRSTLLSACAPPLMTFIIGTGRTCASAPPT